MILKNLQVDGGSPLVSGDVIIGLYMTGKNDPMMCAFLKLSKYYRHIQTVLHSNYEEQSSKIKRSSIEDCVRPLP